MKAWFVYSKQEPGADHRGVIITFPEFQEWKAREWMKQNQKYIDQPGSPLGGATLELVEFETEEEKTARERDEAREALRTFASCVLSARQQNTPEWMEYLAEAVNTACAAIGEDDRFEFDGDGLRRILPD